LKIYGLNILFIIIVAVACNVAPQDAQTPKSESNVVNNPSLNYDQKFSFNTSVETTTEMNGIFTTMLTRTGSNFPASQNVIIRLGGTAENADLSGVLVNGAPATFISPTQFTATFPQGTNSLPISLVTFDDTIFEQQEFFKISLEPNGRDYGIIGNTEFSIIINDNDPYPQAYFATSTYTNDEGLFVDVQVSISNFSENDISVPIVYEALGSTVTSNDSDFINQTLIFNQTNGLGLVQTIRVNLTADAFNELDEILKLKIVAPLQAITGPIPETNITITDPGVAPSYSLQAASYSFNEAGGGNTFALTLQMTGTVENEIIVPLSSIMVTGNIIEGVDYTKTKSSFVIPAGSTNATDTITFTATDDATWEDDEVFQVSIPNTTYANATGNTSATVTLVEVGESIPAIGFIAENYQATEGNTFQLPVELNYRSAYPITVNYTIDTVSSDSATPITDHTLSASGTFIIPAGLKIFNKAIYMVPDGIYDQGEKLRVSISVLDNTQATVAPAIIGPPARDPKDATININEAGGLATISFASELSSATEGSIGQIDFTLSQVSQNDQTFQIVVDEIGATSADFDALTAITGCTVLQPNPPEQRYQITVSSGQTNCSIGIPITSLTADDTLDEPTEQLRLRIIQPQTLNIGSIGLHNFDIIDNDLASTVTIVADNATVNEGASENFTLTLDKASGYDIYVQVAVASSQATLNTDFTLSTQTVFLPKGSTLEAFTLDAIADGNFEDADESVNLSIVAGPNYLINAPGTASLLIVETESAPVLSFRGAASESFTENDIVNIIFELDKPTVENILVEFDRNFVPGTFCDTTEPPTAPTQTYKCANSLEDIPELDSHPGFVIIPAGSTQANLSFKILADGLFELDREEAFEISIDATSANTYSSIDGDGNPVGKVPYPTITNGASSVKLIRIADVDTPSVARFIGDKFAVKNEGNLINLVIPFFLSSPSAQDITFKVQIKQSADTETYEADANDFLLTAGTFLDPTSDHYSQNAGTDVYPGASSSPIDYSADNDVIFERAVTVLAGATSFEIDIDLNSGDSVYENIEQFLVVIASDDFSPAPAYYPYSVNSAHDTFTVNILEKDLPPNVSFSSVLPPATAEGLDTITDPADPLRTQIQDADDSALVAAIANTEVDYTWQVSSFHQHEEMTFDLEFTGTMSFVENYFTKFDYMEKDFIVSFAGVTGDTQVSNSGNVYSFTIPPAGDNIIDAPTLTESIKVEIFKDYQYELDETLIVSLTNPTFLSLGLNSVFTTTILNDDEPPYLDIKIDNTELFGQTYPEYDQEKEINIEATDSDSEFKGQYITSVPFNIVTSIEVSRRLTADISDYTSVTSNLNDTNFYKDSFILSPAIAGDYRRYRSLKLKFVPEAGKTADDSGVEGEIFFEVPEPIIRQSKGNESDGPDNFKGHTCTVFRGKVSCFGNNEFGQLGRESTVNFGGGNSDNVMSQSRTIDLGSNTFNVETYVVDIALGRAHTCVLTSQNEVKCFGSNEFGQLGYGNTSNYGSTTNSMGSSLPSVNLGTTDKVNSIVAMSDSTCALLDNSYVKCWGKNNYGQAGIGSILDTDIGSNSGEMGSSLQNVDLPTSEKKLLSAGLEHACVVTKLFIFDTVKCWGRNDHGQIGLNVDIDLVENQNFGDDVNEPGLSSAIGIYSSIAELALGDNHTCVTIDGLTEFNTRCFGSNYGGQLGTGRTHKTGVSKNPLYNLTSSYSLGVLGATSSLITGFGEDIESDGDSADPGNIPLSVAIIPRNQYVQVREPASSIAGGNSHTCGVYNDYYNESGVRVAGVNIRCWGSSYHYNSVFNQVETGVLNNIGTTSTFDGDLGATTLIPYDTESPNENVFRNSLKVIGDGAYNSEGAQYLVYRYLQVKYGINHSWGWITGLFPSSLNFELNYLFSLSRDNELIRGASYDQIKLSSGSDHLCAVLSKSSVVAVEQLNSKYAFICWGANATGQTGTPTAQCAKPGSSLSCADIPLSTKSFDYTF